MPWSSPARPALVVSALVLSITASAFELEHRINTWLVCGPYATGAEAAFEQDYLGGGVEAMPALGMTAADRTWQWMDDRLYCRNQDDYVDLFTWFLPERPGAPEGGNENVVAYAHAYVWSPVASDAQLLLGASDGLRAWLNGSVVADLPQASRSPVRDEHAFPITLRAGWNRLLVKSANEKDLWGFYAKIAGVGGLHYAVDLPDGALRISTKTLPPGFTGWPYVWQYVEHAPRPNIPSASPFRVLAAGGRPPYAWSVVEGALPSGVTLDPAAGEMLGSSPAVPGTHRFRLRVTDASGASAEQSFSLDVRPRPTQWMEDAKIGGLIHGTSASDHIHGPAEEQATLMAGQGYVYTCPTLGYWPGTAEWPGWYNPAMVWQEQFGFHPAGPHRDAFNAAGVRYGSYLNVRDAMAAVYPPRDADYSTWPDYNAFMHRYLRQWSAQARPAVLWLDGVHLPAPSEADNRGYDFDALYSVVRTLSPETLFVANSGGFPGDDYAFGDCDVFSTEGHNDKPNDCYWDRWPAGGSGLRAKKVPNESWRYPVEGQQDWAEWARVTVSMMCEGHIINLDHSYSPALVALHTQLGHWLEPRLESLQGTRPLPVEDADWGYAVAKEGVVYLHLLSNPRGKQGLGGGTTAIRMGPLEGAVTQAVTVPDGQAVPVTQDATGVVVDMSGVALDPVDTIVRLTLE